jgi:hypothetical protein
VKWQVEIEWMDGEIRTIKDIGQYGPGVIENGAFFCYTKEHRLADVKLTEIIPLGNVRRFKVKEVYW